MSETLALLDSLPAVSPIGHGEPDWCSLHGDIPRTQSIVNHINSTHDTSYDEWAALDEMRAARTGEDSRARALRLRGTDRVARSDSLDSVLAEAEAALPEGWKPLIGREAGGWWATATEPYDEAKRGYRIISTSERGVLYPSMAEALRALTARLQESAPTP